MLPTSKNSIKRRFSSVTLKFKIAKLYLNSAKRVLKTQPIHQPFVSPLFSIVLAKLRGLSFL